MSNIKRILVALDLSVIDKGIINHVAKITNRVELESIYFVHVVEDFSKPKGSEIIGKSSTPIDERIALNIKNEIGDKLHNLAATQVHVLVLEGKPSDVILHTAKVKDVDLIILGNKKAESRASHLTQHVINYAKSSVFLIPDFMPDFPEKIIIPIDFSKHSKLAVDLAFLGTNILSSKDQTKFEVIHAFDIPSGYHYSGKSETEFGEILKTKYHEKYEKFIKEYNLDKKMMSFSPVLSKKNTAETILEYTENHKGSCIIMGAKGRTHLASMLLGSNVKKLLEYNNSFPLIIVKDKNENEDLISSFWSEF